MQGEPMKKKVGKAAPPDPKSKQARVVSRTPVSILLLTLPTSQWCWNVGSREPLSTLTDKMQKPTLISLSLPLSPKALNLPPPFFLLPFNGSFSFLCSSFSHHLLCSPSPPSASKPHSSFSHSLLSQLFLQPLFQANRRRRLLVPSNPFSLQTLPRSRPAFWCCLQLCAGRFRSWLRWPDCTLHRIYSREGELILPI